MANVYTIPKEYKNKDSITILDTDIPLPFYVRNSISKYRFIIIDDIIYLQRKCNECNTFYSVQIFNDNNYTNVDSPSFRCLGKKSGFYHICNKCTNNHLIISETTNKNYISEEVTNIPDTKLQLNIEVVRDLKDFYKILAIMNMSTLNAEVINALNFYKDYLDKSSKN